MRNVLREVEIEVHDSGIVTGNGQQIDEWFAYNNLIPMIRGLYPVESKTLTGKYLVELDSTGTTLSMSRYIEGTPGNWGTYKYPIVDGKSINKDTYNTHVNNGDVTYFIKPKCILAIEHDCGFLKKILESNLSV